MRKRHFYLVIVIVAFLLGGCNWLQGEDGATGKTGPVGLIGPVGPVGPTAAEDMPCLGCIIDVHIADGAIDGRVLGTCAIGAAEIAGAQVGSTVIAAGAVTNPKFNHAAAPPVVGSGQIADATVIGANFAAGAVGPGNVAPVAVEAGDVAANAVDTAQVAVGAAHNFWITPPSALFSPPPAPFNEDAVFSTAGNCSAWETIDWMTLTTDNAKGGAYLAVFNAAINSDFLDPFATESGWVRLTIDGATLSCQSIPSNNEVTGVDYQSISLFGTAQLDASPHTFEAQWMVCDGASLSQKPDTHGTRGLTVIEFAKSAVVVKP